MNISRKKLYWYFVLCALYISAFQMIIRGVLGYISPQMQYSFIVASKLFLFAIPVLSAGYINIDKRFVFPLLLVIYLILLFPVVEYNDPYDFMQGMKNIVLPFFYIPFLIYLYKNDDHFIDNLIKHYLIISIIYSIVLYFEVISYYWPTKLYYLFANMSDLPGNNRYFGRPLGAFLNIQTQGIVFALSSIYCFLTRKYFRFTILAVALFYSLNRTWTAAFFFSMMLAMLLPKQRKKFGVAGLTVFALMLVGSISMILYYFAYFSAGASDGAGIMYKQFLSLKLIVYGMMPHGFYMEGNQSIPGFLYKNEVPILYFLVQMGPIGLLLWLVSLYRPFFSPNIFKRLDTTNGIVLVCSMFGLLHTHGLTLIFNMLFILALSIQLSRKKNYIQEVVQ